MQEKSLRNFPEAFFKIVGLRSSSYDPTGKVLRHKIQDTKCILDVEIKVES